MMKNKHSFSLQNRELHIVEKSKIWFALPLAIVLIALIVFFSFAGVNGWDFSKGINVGIDFAGGTSVSVVFGDEYSEAKLNEVANEIKKFGVDISYTQKTGTGSESAALVKFKNMYSDDAKNMELNEKIQAALQEKYEGKEVAYSAVGSTASSELLATAFLSIFVAAICILVYVVIRFELWSGISAVIALFHDLIIMFSLTVMFRIEINASFIAALITILAYSINDTIVVFDRVRELIKMNTGQKIDYVSITNKAITSTLTRSIYTSITTLMAIAVVAILIPQIRDFALPIVFGILAGTFSSVFLAAPMFVMIKKSLANSKRAKAEKALAAANGVEYVEVSDYAKKQNMWNKFKSNFSSNDKKQTVNAEVVSSDVTPNTEKTKKAKKPANTPYVNPKKKKKKN